MVEEWGWCRGSRDGEVWRRTSLKREFDREQEPEPTTLLDFLRLKDPLMDLGLDEALP